MPETEKGSYLAAHERLKAKMRDEILVKALNKAAWDGQAQAAIDLAKQVGNFNVKLRPYGLTPLHQAVFGSVGPSRHLNVLTAERLIAHEHGAHVDARDNYERTPLYHACRRGDIEMVRALLSQGADPNAAAKNGSTPLHCAAESGNLTAVRMLLAEGATEYPKATEIKPTDHEEGEKDSTQQREFSTVPASKV